MSQDISKKNKEVIEIETLDVLLYLEKHLSVSFVHFNQAYHLCKHGELYAHRNLMETHSATDWKLSIG